MRLMIVDDSSVIRSKIERIQKLSNRYVVVGSAANGQEAVDNFIHWQPDIVTMDLTMPHMDGIACIEQLININPDINILVVSAISDKDTGIEALIRGARGFLCKPFTEDELNDALASLVD